MNKKDIYTEDVHNIFLTMEDGRDLECRVLTRFPLNGNQYIVLLPLEDEDKVEASALVYRYSEDRNGDPILDLIEDDEEYEAVADRYDEIMDEDEYDEIVGEDEV